MKKIRLGLSATLTGSLSLQGIDSFNGLTLWAEFQNSLGGIYVKEIGSGLPVDLIYLDDKSDPALTKEITAHLINHEEVDLLLGPYSSSLSLACAEVAENSGRVVWNYGGSTDEILGDKYKNTVTLITPASRYLDPYLEFIKDRHDRGPAIAIVYAEDSGFSRQVSGGAIRFCIENNIAHKIYTYRSGTDNFLDIIGKIRVDSINTVIGVGRYEDDLRFAPHLEGFNACLPAAAIDQFHTELGIRSNGFCSISQWEPEMNFIPDFGIDSAVFTELYSNRFGKIPDYVSAQSFNIGVVLSHFIEKLGTINEIRLKEEILNSRFKTFYGDFSGGNSYGGHKTVATQWQDGKKQIIYPSSHATSDYKLP